MSIHHDRQELRDHWALRGHDVPPSDDYIDFPCSPAWLDYYHERGLTERHSENYGRRVIQDDRYERLERALISMSETVKELSETVFSTINKKPEPKEFQVWKPKEQPKPIVKVAPKPIPAQIKKGGVNID